MEAFTEGYDHMITFYEDQNKFFGDLAISDPHRAVSEITDYMLESRHDPPIVFHIELMEILAEAYERSGQFRFAQIALDEVEYLSRDLRLPMDEVEATKDVGEAAATGNVGEAVATGGVGEAEAQQTDDSLPDVGGLQLEDQVSPQPLWVSPFTRPRLLNLISSGPSIMHTKVSLRKHSYAKRGRPSRGDYVFSLSLAGLHRISERSALV